MLRALLHTWVAWLGLCLLLGSQSANERTYPNPEDIYKDLLGYLNVSLVKAPQLAYAPVAKARGAVFEPEHQTIWIDQWLVDTLRGSQPPARYRSMLTMILAHELGHFFQQSSCSAARLIGLPAYLSPLGNEQLQMQRELEADYYAAFAWYLTESSDQYAPEALALFLAQHYPSVDTYPAAAARLEAFRQGQVRAMNLTYLYRTGLHLLLIREFEAAKDCFLFLSREFRSRKVLNNLAACYLQMGQEVAPTETLPLAYPLEVDPLSRLERHIREPKPGNSSLARQLWRQADTALRAALALDPSYQPTRINLATLAALRHEYNYFQDLGLLEPSYQQFFQGVKAAKLGKNLQARDYWKPLTRSSPSLAYLAQLNLGVLNGILPSPKRQLDSRGKLPRLPTMDWNRAHQEAKAILSYPGDPPLQCWQQGKLQWYIWGDSIAFLPLTSMGSPQYASINLAQWGTPDYTYSISPYLGQVFWEYGLIAWETTQRSIHYLATFTYR